jgi:hypothetical protein
MLAVFFRSLTLFLARPFSYTLMMEATYFSETSVLTRETQRNISEEGVLHSHRRENLKSYKELTGWIL